MADDSLEDDWEVTCARCGKVGMASLFMVEEGDEWECPPCWERCEAQERQQSNAHNLRQSRKPKEINHEISNQAPRYRRNTV